MKGGARWAIGLAAVGAITGVAALALQRPPAPLPARIGPPLSPRYAGVNLASGEFNGKKLPGKYGIDYVYPSARDAAPFLAAGMTAVRLPFRWERLQPVPGQPFDPAEARRIDAMVTAMSGFRLIILDPHNYAGHSAVKLGQPTLPAATFADLWERLARRYGGNPRIAFGLMNEPIGVEAMAWRALVEDALRAIRGTGARNLVLVPGIRWTGAHSWAKGSPSNAQALAGLRDPGGNMAFEFHQYVDGNSSGLGKTCITPEVAAARLNVATRWLREQRARGFLGEFGAPPTPECLAALDGLLGALDSGSDVWLGWTYWAAGPRWNRYPLSIQPGRDGPKPQMSVLLRHVPG